MANTFNVSSLVSRQMVQTLHHNDMLAKTVNTDYTADVTQKKYMPGDTISIDIEHQPSVTSGRVGTPQDIVRLTTSATIGQYHAIISLQSLERRYDLGSEKDVRKIGDMLGKRLIRECNVTGYQFMRDQFAQNVGTPGTEPGAIRTWAEGRAKILEHLPPEDRDCYAAYSPNAGVALIDSMKGIPGYKDQNYSGEMRRTNGMRFYETPSIARHTAGSCTNASTVAMNGATATGATTISIDGLSAATATITKGTKFTIADVYDVDPETKATLSNLKEFDVLADATGSGSAITALSIGPTIYDSTSPHQNVSALPADDATVTLKNINSEVDAANVIYDKDAVSLISVPLPLPIGGSASDASLGSVGPIKLRTAIGSYNTTNDNQALRVDGVWAWALLRREHGAIVWGD